MSRATPADPPTGPDCYRSLENGEEVESKVKASRFLGRAFRVETEDESSRRLASVRKKYHDATHHCSALRLGPPGAVRERADDDGEPAGTAGPPMLAVVQGLAIHDALVIVTRWFGGTKLGKGGLIRAYSDAARAALEAAPSRTVWREVTIVAECSYDDVGAVEVVLAREGGGIRRCARDFSKSPTFTITVMQSRGPHLAELLREATSGRATIRS